MNIINVKHLFFGQNVKIYTVTQKKNSWYELQIINQKEFLDLKIPNLAKKGFLDI